jgi:hypothetical protein
MSETATTVLGEQLEASDPEVTKPVETPTDNYLSRYVGEGKKYATAEDLAKAYEHVQMFAETLKTEKTQLEDTMKAELAKAKTVEDIMSVLTTAPSHPEHSVTDQGAPTMDAEKVAELVEATLTKRQQVELIKANQQKAWTKLDQIFGDRETAKQAVTRYINGDASRRNLVDQMGSYTPDDFVELIALKNKKEVVTFTEPNTVQEAYVPSSHELTWKDVQKVKRENPAHFKSREFQLRLHKLAAEGKLN